MNIHQLLSISQGSPQTQSSGAINRQDPVNDLFHQALLQASETARLPASGLSEVSVSQAPQQQATLNALGSLVLAGLEVDIEDLSSALETLGLDVSESDVSELLAQLQLPNSDTLGLDAGQVSTQLDEIADRLALMASFSEGSTAKQLNISPNEPSLSINPAALEAIADRLNISQIEAAQLADTPALQTVIQSLNMDKDRLAQAIDPAALEAITDQLNINQTEAAQLVSALNVWIGQPHSTQTVPVDSGRLADVRPSAMELQNTSRTQANTLVTQINTVSASPQISSEALTGALLKLEGSSKGSSAGEHLLTGFSLSAGSPAASAQSAQVVTPTPLPIAAALSTPVTSPAWSQQLGQQLVQISQRGGEQHVQMQLNPAELGPLSISLKFGEQGAQAHFLSAHAQVRQILEQALPQLREALAEQGISLGETSVGEQRDPNDQAFAQSSSKNGTKTGSDSGEVGLDEAAHQNSGSSNPLALDGRVDLYA